VYIPNVPGLSVNDVVAAADDDGLPKEAMVSKVMQVLTLFWKRNGPQ
jgi:hypothetical protein